MVKKYAIFDMDGTLVDSMPYWKKLAEEYLQIRGIYEIQAEILEKIRPMTIFEAAVYFKKIYQFSMSPEEIAEDVNRLMAEHYKEDIPLKAGVESYLEKLKERRIRMCVASATAESLMEACLGRLGILDKFEFLISCETVGAGKYSPEIYWHAVKKMGANPEETVVYEDALHAVRTAKQAGFYVAAVYDDNGKDVWEKITTIADETILSWEDAG